MKKIAKGWHSEIYLTDKGTVIKRFKKNLEKNFEKEVKFLTILKDYGFVPKIISYNKENLEVEIEYVQGVPLKDFLKEATKEEIIKVLRRLLEICHLLDTMKIQKDELTNPKKDISITNNRIILLDWERAKETKKPHNVTQFVTFIYKIKNLLEEKGIILSDFSSILLIIQEYLKVYDKKVFGHLVNKLFEVTK